MLVAVYKLPVTRKLIAGESKPKKQTSNPKPSVKKAAQMKTRALRNKPHVDEGEAAATADAYDLQPPGAVRKGKTARR